MLPFNVAPNFPPRPRNVTMSPSPPHPKKPILVKKKARSVVHTVRSHDSRSTAACVLQHSCDNVSVWTFLLLVRYPTCDRLTVASAVITCCGPSTERRTPPVSYFHPLMIVSISWMLCLHEKCRLWCSSYYESSCVFCWKCACREVYTPQSARHAVVHVLCGQSNRCFVSIL